MGVLFQNPKIWDLLIYLNFGTSFFGLLLLEQKKRIQDITRRINKHLKIIGDKLGILGVSTYTASQSFATVLKRSGANISYISESLGHSSLKTTENYLASFEKEERITNAKFLTNFGD